MSETPNKLYSKEQIEEWADQRADDAGRLSRQLLDAMRENERLLHINSKVYADLCDIKRIAEAQRAMAGCAVASMAEDALQRYKESKND